MPIDFDHHVSHQGGRMLSNNSAEGLQIWFSF